ncbi:aldo/keto reductase [Massilia sp. W12]|uniref:aldo/keto reductase n=1 Tax=Massilia sp. W12 TaxID=3126507 RepID=UPI0030D27B63
MSTLCPRIQIAPQGPEFSRIVAGMWRMCDWEQAGHLRLIQECLELGVTTFDHADIYGDYQVQSLFGAALAQQPGLRAKMELVSKCGICLPSRHKPEYRLQAYDTSARHIIASAEQSLRELRTDYLDLLLLHRPDPLLDIGEVTHAFNTLHKAGKVRHFGVSNFSSAQFQALNAHWPLVTNQIELSPLYWLPIVDGALDLLQSAGVRPMLWSALGGGRLFGADCPPALRATLEALAIKHQVSIATLVYAWLLRLPCRALPLTGSGRIAAIREAVAACSLDLPREDWFELWQAMRGRPVE